MASAVFDFDDSLRKEIADEARVKVVKDTWSDRLRELLQTDD